MMEIGGFFGLILLALNIWAIVSILGSTATTGRKVVWTLLILVLPLVGFIAWYVTGPRSRTQNI
ncbi:PLD nuclease N-terminal domain-containing protein [Rhodobacteraceae bacterium]|nr:PLD nuclease N-terminal domain-containing protein [Paracoccaceae bacterium]